MGQHKKRSTKQIFTRELLSAIAGWLLVTAVLWIDLETGNRYRLGILYQLAIVLIAYYVNIWYALLVAFVCSILRPYSLHIEGRFFPSIDVPMINSIVRFMMFSLTATLTVCLRSSVRVQNELKQKLLDAHEEILRLKEGKFKR
jgi:K+-sensing histidine kinase KdpD